MAMTSSNKCHSGPARTPRCRMFYGPSSLATIRTRLKLDGTASSAILCLMGLTTQDWTHRQMQSRKSSVSRKSFDLGGSWC